MYFDINVWALDRSLPQKVSDKHDLQSHEELKTKLFDSDCKQLCTLKAEQYFAKPSLQIFSSKSNRWKSKLTSLGIERHAFLHNIFFVKLVCYDFVFFSNTSVLVKVLSSTELKSNRRLCAQSWAGGLSLPLLSWVLSSVAQSSKTRAFGAG